MVELSKYAYILPASDSSVTVGPANVTYPSSSHDLFFLDDARGFLLFS